MPLYDADNRLTSDSCAIKLKDQTNRSISAYTFERLRAACPRGGAGVQDCHPIGVASKHRNLRAWDGYGLNVCEIDNDSGLRLDSEVTHPRMRIQLPKRVFQAAPNLAHGQPEPELEARMLNGMDTGAVRLCSRLAEKSYNRFDPGVQRVHVENVVPQWTNGGDSSRNISRSSEFLTSLGYVHDGKVWRRGI